MSEKKTLLKVENATMQFGGVVAVDNLNLEVNEGEIVALIGPNGAGKTTAFNVITGVYAPSNGRITFDGECIVRNHPTGKMKKLYKGENPLLYTAEYHPADETKEQMLARDPLAGRGGAAATGAAAGLGAAAGIASNMASTRAPQRPLAQLVDVVSGESHSITSAQVTIGRERSVSDIALRDPNVSRRHAQLTFTGSDWSIEDLNSTNGTLVNNRRITRCPLRNGDLLTFGLSTFEFRG